MRQKLVILAIFFTSIFAGCSSISSSPEKANKKGLVYFLPKKDFKITITKTDSNIKSINFDVTEAYPDRTQAYTLSHNTNLFGDNKSFLTIKSNGLLTSATSSVDSKVNQSLINLAKSAGEAAAVAVMSEEEKTGAKRTKSMFGKNREGLIFKCHTDKEEHSYTIIIPALEKHLYIDHDVCDIIVKIEPRSEESVKGVTPEEGSGIFYRQEIPYLITASTQPTSNQILLDNQVAVATPSLSMTHFLPLSKSFFANNKAEFVFSDGVPTSYKQDTDSEFVNLFKLPGDILEGWFSGIGSIFNAFKTNTTTENDLLKEAILRDKNEYLRSQCKAATIAKDDALIQRFCIGNQ